MELWQLEVRQVTPLLRLISNKIPIYRLISDGTETRELSLSFDLTLITGEIKKPALPNLASKHKFSQGIQPC